MTQQGEIVGERHAGARMPVGVRRSLTVLLASVLAGAAYLIALRGEALLLDLSAFSERIFCF